MENERHHGAVRLRYAMATTAVFFETIIIGFQVIVWIGLLLSIFLGSSWLEELKEFGDWAIIGSALFIGLAYTLGLICNRVAEESFYRYSRVRKLLDDLPRHPMELRTQVWTQDPQTADRLEVWARECSLLRSTSVNVLLISVSGVALMLKVWGFSWFGLFAGLSISLLVTTFVYWSWGQAVASYYGHLVTAHDRLTQEQQSENSTAGE